MKNHTDQKEGINSHLPTTNLINGTMQISDSNRKFECGSEKQNLKLCSFNNSTRIAFQNKKR